MNSSVPDVGAESPALPEQALEMVIHFVLDDGPVPGSGDGADELSVAHNLSTLRTLVNLTAEEAVMVKDTIGRCIGIALTVEQADGQPYFWSGRVSHPGNQTEEVR